MTHDVLPVLVLDGEGPEAVLRLTLDSGYTCGASQSIWQGRAAHRLVLPATIGDYAGVLERVTPGEITAERVLVTWRGGAPWLARAV